MQRNSSTKHITHKTLFAQFAQKNANITDLVVSNGNPQTSIKQIINICHEFYANLYKQKTADSKIQTFLSEFAKKLKPHQQIDLGNKIIKTEVKVAINTTNNGKIRCPVKLSIEFCNGSWRIVGSNVRKFFLIDSKWKGA